MLIQAWAATLKSVTNKLQDKLTLRSYTLMLLPALIFDPTARAGMGKYNDGNKLNEAARKRRPDINTGNQSQW
jgi:hypothetical protein